MLVKAAAGRVAAGPQHSSLAAAAAAAMACRPICCDSAGSLPTASLLFFSQMPQVAVFSEDNAVPLEMHKARSRLCAGGVVRSTLSQPGHGRAAPGQLPSSHAVPAANSCRVPSWAHIQAVAA